MDKSTLSNYGWIVIVTLVLAVMLALATPFGTFVGKGASNVIKTFVQSSDNAVDEDNIDTQSEDWDIFLNNTDSEHSAIIPEDGIYESNGNTYTKGETFPEPQIDDKYTYGNYRYTLINSSLSTFNNEWRCMAIAPTEDNVIFKSPLSYINGKPVTVFVTTFSIVKKPYKLADDFKIPETARATHMMFNNSTGLSELPEGFKIPNNVQTQYGMFQRCTNLKKLPESFAFSENAKDLHWMFLGCSSLETIPESFKFPEGTNMVVGLFSQCTSLKSIPSTFKFPNTKNLSLQAVFSNCTSLETLPANLTLPENVSGIPYLFQNCSSLKSIPASFIIDKNIKDMEEAFKGCTSLTGTLVINADLSKEPINDIYPYTEAFTGTTQPITIKGSCAELPQLAASAENGNVTIG